MQITITIPDENSGEVLAFIAGLARKAAISERDIVEPSIKTATTDERLSVTPHLGWKYFTRSGDVAVVESKDGNEFKGKIKIGDEWEPYYWSLDGQSKTNYRPLDLVEITPF